MSAHKMPISLMYSDHILQEFRDPIRVHCVTWVLMSRTKHVRRELNIAYHHLTGCAPVEPVEHLRIQGYSKDRRRSAGLLCKLDGEEKGR